MLSRVISLPRFASFLRRVSVNTVLSKQIVQEESESPLSSMANPSNTDSIPNFDLNQVSTKDILDTNKNSEEPLSKASPEESSLKKKAVYKKLETKLKVFSKMKRLK